MDLSGLSDVALTELWLSKVKDYPATRDIVVEIDHEMRGRGKERLLAAWAEVSAKRGNCCVCGDCKPVAAYGGWCCARALRGQEVTP